MAAFPANQAEDTIFSHSGITFGGLIYGIDHRTIAIRDTFSTMLEYYRAKGMRKIYYKTIPYIFHRYPSQEDLYALYLSNARLVRRDLSSIIKLRNRPKISSNRKSGISKAKKANLRTEVGSFYGEFHKLLSSALKTHGVLPVHSENELALLHSRFPNNIRLEGVFQDNELIAATWLFDFGNCLHTQYLASSDKGKALGALDFLLSSIIENAPPHIEYISFGVSTDNNGRNLNEGLIHQKEGFGGRGVVLDHYEIDL